MTEREERANTAFGYLFSLAQRWQTLGDQFLAQWQLTTKQWLLLATLELGLDGSATLGEAAQAYGSSHQNVKRIARNLERSGFLRLFKDPGDRRILRLEMTEKNHRFWKEHEQETQRYINQLFETLSNNDIQNLARILAALESHTGQIGVQ